jgi:hypothetical protein
VIAVTPRCSILVVNGFDRDPLWRDHLVQEAQQYPWIKLCLSQIEKHSASGDYLTMVYDNSCLPSHQQVMRDRPSVQVFPANGAHVELAHGVALDHLVRQTPPTIPYVITLDSDAFPISDGWIDRLISAVQAGNAVSGIYRDEMSSLLRPFVHPSCLCARRDDLLAYGVSFKKGDGQEPGQRLFDVLTRDRPYYPLRRSNVRNVHAVMGGVYGDLIYHHGAGSRRPVFWGSPVSQRNDVVRERLRNAAFADLPQLVAELLGRREPMLTAGLLNGDDATPGCVS